MPMKSLILISLLPFSLLLTACDKTAQTPADTAQNAANVNAVEAREDIMNNWKDSVDAMGDMLESPTDFDADNFEEQAQYLATDASRPWQYFEDANDIGDATEAVWSQPKQFENAIARFEQASAHLSNAAKTATTVEGVQSAYDDVTASCKSCHKTFKD